MIFTNRKQSTVIAKEEFLQALQELNIPRHYIKNKHLKTPFVKHEMLTVPVKRKQYVKPVVKQNKIDEKQNRIGEEFADDDPKWDETQPCIERMPSTSKQAASILNIEPSTLTNLEGTRDARASLSSKESEIKLGNVKCPVHVTNISTLEKLNNVRINVFGFEDEIFPLYVSSREDLDCINLLYISNEERQHYCLIRNFSRLIGDLSKHKRAHICYRCLHRFCREDLLQEHLNYCKNVSPQKIKMPSPDRNILQFQKIEFQHKVPFIIYADFESIIIPYHSVQPKNQSAYTEKIARHEPCGYAYVVIDANGKMLKPITVYRGPDAATHFINNLIKEKDQITPMITTIMPMNLSPEEEEQFNSETRCYLCKHLLENDKVRDHCHLSGRYRGAAHNYCNLKYKMRKMIPVVFHNLKNYDAHHIIKCLGNFKDHEFNILANNMEKYITFSMRKNIKENNVTVSLQFIDSFQFLPTSLQKLVQNLKDSDFNILKQNVSLDKIHLLLRKGLKLTKVHKVLSFKQKPWLKPYIEFNTNQRKLASSSFEKDFFKLLNNSVYGKTMENVRKHSNVQLVTSEKQAKKLVAAPTFKRFKIITESLVVLEKLKSCITLNRPIYIGFVILELSKVLMYNFHYNHIKKRYMDKANLLFTDTDSLTYEIETEDIYRDMGENLNIYDTSDYPQDHALYSEKNKKRIGCFKDEINSRPIIEFVSLRAKMYSMLTPDSEKKTAKGVSKVVIQQKLKHSNYLQCLKENKSTKENMILIKSENHDIYTVRQNKTALSSFDDKRYILDDNIGTFAYGHYKINENPI
ncbi:PR domain zinc finger protein 4 [Trichonephila clavata]|uniref:PR domain zinc finger protein 4 n=1 Tax=Trichonephila clavata TaxID=2740835 RepID=A0A8X6GLL6_TRICU|nr:PR domain zinc finger protein 4 [Trichonephila clavata]